MSVFDCCLFSGEVDHLLIRLTELEGVVDYFVVAESTVSFQGESKALWLPNLLSEGLLDRWVHKMLVVYVDDVPGLGADRGPAGSDWFMLRERYVRNAMARGYLDIAKGNDLILISDVDEIPTTDAIAEANARLHNTERCLVFCMDSYVWSRSWVWPGPSWNTCAYLAGSGMTPQEARDARGPLIDHGHIVKNAGWHLTWQGSPEDRAHKLMTFSHAEHLNKLDELDDIVAAGMDINGVPLFPVDVDNTAWPVYFDDHPELWR